MSTSDSETEGPTHHQAKRLKRVHFSQTMPTRYPELSMNAEGVLNLRDPSSSEDELPPTIHFAETAHIWGEPSDHSLGSASVDERLLQAEINTHINVEANANPQSDSSSEEGDIEIIDNVPNGGNMDSMEFPTPETASSDSTIEQARDGSAALVVAAIIEEPVEDGDIQMFDILPDLIESQYTPSDTNMAIPSSTSSESLSAASTVPSKEPSPRREMQE